ncbi:MAG: hypothetical protein R3C02_05465 [Planctomycetaceae bacterium]
MRIVGEDQGNQVRYACIAAKDHEDDIPKDMPLPEESHKDILAKGYDLGFEVLNRLTRQSCERSRPMISFPT